MEIIMNSNEYKNFGYYRSLDSYMKEWNAHNFLYNIDIFDFWRSDHTANVNLDKDLSKDKYAWVYRIF